MSDMQKFAKPLLVVCLALLIAGLYWRGAVKQLANVNTDMQATDQKAYMDYARSMYESGYTFIGGRNRMPLYPFLQSLFLRPGMTDEEFFLRGKYINLILSLGILIGLALIFYRFFLGLHTLNVMLITTFTIFAFKAGWFQAELLFYFFNFCLFLLMWQLLQRPSWQLAILTGIVAGLTHLLKASILPGLAIFLALGFAQWGYQRRLSLKGKIKSARLFPFELALVVVFFALTIFPYINTSKKVFGRYFYNVNATFYIWYDSWDEVKLGTRAYGDRVGWPDMPPEEIPTMPKYLREHTTAQIIRRFVKGAQRVWSNVVNSYGYFKYVVIYSSLLLVAIFWRWRQARQIIKSKPIQSLFLAAYFTACFLLYFWYVPIAEGNRLILAQFLPLMFVISSGLFALLRPSRVQVGGYSAPVLTVANWMILALIVADINLILLDRVAVMYGGL